MIKNSGRQEAKALVKKFRSGWKRFLAIQIAVSVLIFTVLTPLASLLLRLAVEFSGKAALSDQDILFFALTPFGFLAALVLGSVFSIIMFLGHGALVIAAATLEQGEVSPVRAVITHIASHFKGLFSLSLNVLIRVLLNIAPFALLLYLIYAGLLSEFDINYYLAEKPNDWWIALALGAVVALICALNLLRLFVNYLFCLPLLLLGDYRPTEAIAASSNAVKGHRRAIAGWLLMWLAASGLMTAMVSGFLTLSGYYLIPYAATSMTTLIAALGMLSLMGFLLYFTASFIASSLLGLLIFKLYCKLDLPVRTKPGNTDQSGVLNALPMNRRTLFAGLAAALVVTAFLTWWQISNLEIKNSTEIMAHRGASAAAPENTIAAIQGAIDAGAQWVEIDVQESADGHVVVIHDSDLKKIGGSPLTVAGSTLEQLQQVDIGSWFGPEFADQRVPTLEEVLELCRGRIGINIELKYYGKQVRLEERVAEVVEKAGMADQVMVMSLSYSGIQTMRAIRPDWKVGLLSSVSVGNLANLDVDFLALNGRAASRALIRRAHEKGKQVMVWTVNDAVAMASMMSRGADALITDEPALASEITEQFDQLDSSQRLLLQLADLFDHPGLYQDQ